MNLKSWFGLTPGCKGSYHIYPNIATLHREYRTATTIVSSFKDSGTVTGVKATQTCLDNDLSCTYDGT